MSADIATISKFMSKEYDPIMIMKTLLKIPDKTSTWTQNNELIHSINHHHSKYQRGSNEWLSENIVE